MPAEKRRGVRATLGKYGENTSAHGIPRAVTTKSLVRRIFWTCLFLASFSYFLYQAVQLVDRYTDYPVNTDVKIAWSELEFPAVTICNANPIRFLELQKLGDEGGFRTAGFIPMPPQMPVSPKPTTQASTTTTAQSTSTSGDEEYDYEGYHGDFNTLNAFSGLILQLNDSMRQSLGHQAQDLIQECQFDGRACSYRNFSEFRDTTYGNCFTFNKLGHGPVVEHSNSAGPLHGLSLILYIEQEQYIPSIAEKAGVRVVIHSPDRFPFPESEGFDAAPGFLTSAGLRLTSISRLGGLYGDCTNGAGHELLYSGSYTQQNCLATCHQSHMQSVCDCADVSFMKPEGATYCNSSTSTVECEERVKERLASKNLTCSCPASCTDKVYRMAMGLAEWPADSYLPTVLSKLRTRSRGPGTGILDDSDQFKRNLLKLNIYYEALNYESISESAAYQFESLLGDLGGQLGLWVGMSCLSAMEVVELLADMFIIFWRKLSNRDRPSSSRVGVGTGNVSTTNINTSFYNGHTLPMTEKM